VGSLLRDPETVAAGQRGGPDGTPGLDQAARAAISLQQEIGLDVITDGEVRRQSWAQPPRFLDCFAVTEGRAALDWRGGTQGVPGVTGRVRGYPAVVRRGAGAARTGDM